MSTISAAIPDIISAYAVVDPTKPAPTIAIRGIVVSTDSSLVTADRVSSFELILNAPFSEEACHPVMFDFRHREVAKWKCYALHCDSGLLLLVLRSPPASVDRSS